MLLIPITSSPAFTQEITLDGIPYRLAFSFNFRAERWVMSIYDRDRAPLVEGIRLVADYPLLAQFPGRGLPPGEMLVVNPGEFGGIEVDRIGLDEFGTTHQLVYFEEAEVAVI